VDVELGRLRTDGQGRLIVLGGKGFSSAGAGTPLGISYYVNPGWHDDVSDGPVTAQIRLTPSSAPVEAEGGAWVIVAPPDYAPQIDCVVTLYDVMQQVGIDKLGHPKPGFPSFDVDIAPILSRVRRLRWVHADATWSDPRLDSPDLRRRDVASQKLRLEVRGLVLQVESVFSGHTDSSGPPFRLRKFQQDFLDAWVNGNFDDTPVTPMGGLTAAGLTRAALDGAAGQGFCPGIEAGIIMLDDSLYARPFDFRIDQTALDAGDLTALMAQPWQADFLKCHDEWWPAQRPDIAPQPDGTSKDWARGVTDHSIMVERHGSLGVVARQGPAEVFLEVERDPSFP
jgi:hypothetical protein